MTKFIIDKRTDALKTDVNLFFIIIQAKTDFQAKERNAKVIPMEDTIVAGSEFHRCNSENHRLVN